jgi:hypothetical protein
MRLAEERGAFEGIVAELIAEDAEGAGGIAEAASDFGRWFVIDEEGAEGLVLALQGNWGERKKFWLPGVVI